MGIQKITTMKCTCERCGHKWNTRREEIPKVCPKCKSPYWNIPRRKNK